MHPYIVISLERASPDARTWLERALREIELQDPAAALLPAYAAARRKLGDRLIELTVEQAQANREFGSEPPHGWKDAELGRAGLLIATLARLPEPEHAPLVHQLYTKGDNAERRAVLRALTALPAPERYLSTAVDACRTHVVPIFEAIACDNGYPERYFPDEAFNQLVMKALFLSIPLDRVRGLESRSQPELVRMASDHAAERLAAGRSVPADIARIPGFRIACGVKARALDPEGTV